MGITVLGAFYTVSYKIAVIFILYLFEKYIRYKQKPITSIFLPKVAIFHGFVGFLPRYFSQHLKIPAAQQVKNTR